MEDLRSSSLKAGDFDSGIRLLEYRLKDLKNLTQNYLLLILLFGVLIRSGFLITPHIDSDQAIFGLQGRHILNGELPIFSWGYAYMGTFQSYLDAAVFYIFGSSRLVLDSVTTFLSLFFILVTYLLGKELFGERGGLLSALFAADAPPYLTFHGAWARHGYVETLLFGSLILLITLKLSRLRPEAQPEGMENQKDRVRFLILLGFVSGLGFWTNFLIFVYLPASVLYLILKDKRLFRKETLLIIPPFLLGSLPFWIYNLGHSFESLGIIHGGIKRPFIENLKDALIIGMPEIMGAKTEEIMLHGPSYALISIYLLSLILLIIVGIKDLIPSHRGRMWNEKAGIGLILLFFLSFFTIFSASGFGGFIGGTRRYLLPLYSGVPLLLTLFLFKIREHSKLIMAGTMVFVLGFNMYGNLKSYSFLKEKELKSYRDERRLEKDLFDFMKREGLFHAYVFNYWIGPRLTFESGEKIIFAQPFADRYADYTRRVDKASKSAYLIENGMEGVFEKDLYRLGASYIKKEFGRYTLFYSINPPRALSKGIPPQRWSAISRPEGEGIKNTYDREMTTRWRTKSAQASGMYYMIDTGDTYRINKVSLIPGLPHDSPRGCRIELSRDGDSWREVANIKDYLSLYWDKGRLRIDESGRLIAIFDPIAARFVKITLTEDDPKFDWSITEIFLYEKDKGNLRPKTHLHKGNLYEREGRLADAIREYKKALMLDPGLEDAYHPIGRIYYSLGILDKSSYERGLILEGLKLYEEADSEYKILSDGEAKASPFSEQIYSTRQIEHLLGFYERLGGRKEVVELRRLKDGFRPEIKADARFQKGIRFLGYNISKHRVSRGGSFDITYFWQSERKINKGYAIFVHFMKGSELFQNDHYPLNGLYGTSKWSPGEGIKENFKVVVPETLSPGLYEIRLGVWDPKSGKRLKVKKTGLRAEEEAISIGWIEVL